MLAAKIDANQGAIVEALRKCGALVLSLASVGKGCPDLLVSYRGDLVLMEVKGEKGRLTPDQVEFHSEWPVSVVRTVEDAMMVIGVIDSITVRTYSGEVFQVRTWERQDSEI